MADKPSKNEFVGVLAQPINREAPWLSLAEPSEQDRARDRDEATRVGLERWAKLPELARHFGIAPTIGQPAHWLGALASRLAVELGVPGFQERWTGPVAESLKEHPAVRNAFSAQLGLTRGPTGGIIGKPPGEIGPTTAAMMAELVRTGDPTISNFDAAIVILDSLGKKFKSLARKAAAARTLENKIIKGNRILAQQSASRKT